MLLSVDYFLTLILRKPGALEVLNHEDLRMGVMEDLFYSMCLLHIYALLHKVLVSQNHPKLIFTGWHILFSNIQLCSTAATPFLTFTVILIPQSSMQTQSSVGPCSMPTLMQNISCTCTSISSHRRLTLLIRRVLATFTKFKHLIKSGSV